MANRKRWFLLALKLSIVCLVAWFVRQTVGNAVAELRLHPVSLHFGWLSAGGVFYLLGQVPAGWYWHRLMVVAGGHPTMLQTMRAYFIGHLGKYVPGKALVVVMRAGLIRSDRVDSATAATTVFFETLTTMAVGASLAAAIVAFWLRDHWELVLLSIGLMVCSALPMWPPMFRRIAKLLKIGRSNPELIERLATLEPRVVLAGWLALAIGWVLVGLALWAVMRAMGSPGAADFAELPRYTASAALAIVAGFLSLIPGGLFVREAILLKLLSSEAAGGASSTALMAAVLLRLVSLLAELIISGILYFVPTETLARRAS